jgi:hypothetical protein
MKLYSRWLRRLALTGAGAAVAMVPLLAAAPEAMAERKVVLRAADSSRAVDAGAAAAAAAARLRAGPLPGMNTAAKKAANRAAAAQKAQGAPNTAEAGGPRVGRLATQIAGLNDPGQDADAMNTSTPPDTTGAIGATRFIQLVNTRFGIYNRATGALITQGTLATLFQQPANASSFDPQILWDNQTQRFYYLGDTIRSAADNVLSFGWSTGPSPANGTTHWCHYEIGFNPGSIFPDYPKLGDSQFFIIFGTNDFNGNTPVGSTVWAIGKPPSGQTCPSAASLIFGARIDIRDAATDRIFTPVPANDIDTKALGYWVAMDDDVVFSGITSNRLYVGSVSRNAGTGAPIFNNPKNLTVANYTLPAAATQLSNTRDLDSLDARNTQAQMSRNPDRTNQYSIWTQHTIRGASAASSFVRWYEINPFPTPPTVLRTGNIGQNTPNTFFYNGAISPDRRADGAVRQFGDSFVINYNASRAGAGGFNPRFNVGSSFNGGAVGGFLTVRNSPGANFDFSCPGVNDTCRWGDYAAATPDPKPTPPPSGTNRGTVWSTNQTAGPGATVGNPTWDTWFAAHRP